MEGSCFPAAWLGVNSRAGWGATGSPPLQAGELVCGGHRNRRGCILSPSWLQAPGGLHPSLSLRCKIHCNIANTAFTYVWTSAGCTPESGGRGEGLSTFHWPQGSLGTTKITATLSRKKLYAFFIQQEKNCKRTNDSRRWVEVPADSYFTEQFKIIYNIRKP